MNDSRVLKIYMIHKFKTLINPLLSKLKQNNRIEVIQEIQF